MSVRPTYCIGTGTPDKALRYKVEAVTVEGLDDVKCGMEWQGQIVTRIDRAEWTVDLMWLSDYQAYFERASRARTPVL